MSAAEPTFRLYLEEDLQRVDRATGALCEPATGRIAADKAPAPPRKLFATAAAAVHDLLGRRARTAAHRAGAAVVAAGLHPNVECADPLDVPCFGLRIYVEIATREAAVRALCGAALYIPHLLALSASSPLHLGRDTGYDSYRTLLRDLRGRGGLPQPVASGPEYEQLIRILTGDRPVRHEVLAWDIRPGPRETTVLFDFLDACPTRATLEALAACARALTAMFEDRPPPQPTGIELQVLRENRWRAARHGLDARFFRMDPVTAEERSARDCMLALVERLAPLAERLGDSAALAGVASLLEAGNIAAHMRRIHRETHAARAVVAWLAEQSAAAGEARAA